jgi:hypothetical protein
MSRYPVKPYDLRRIKTYPLKDRTSKVTVESFARPYAPGKSFLDFVSGLPKILAARDLKNLARAIADAHKAGKAILWGIGGHVIKTGISPVLIDLMDRGLVTGLAMNGAAMIHDFEIALIGSTSEDVEKQLQQGAFGMATETGQGINEAIATGSAAHLGIGESLGRYLAEIKPAFGQFSVLLQAYLRNIPVTVHVAIGADIIHSHPNFPPAATGEGSHRDFRLFASLVAGLNEGGVYLNCGSAVTLPEVFLKCISLVRSGGDRLQDFTTANLDFIQHYRPTENVLKRPIRNGGQGIALTGHHEILMPLLAAEVIEMISAS